jgi:hypothetical protein
LSARQLQLIPVENRADCCLLRFVVYGRQIAVGGRWPLAVVKDFKLFKNGLSSLSTGLIGVMVYKLGFQGMEDAFRYCIIPAIPFKVHALPDAVLL